MFTTNSFLNTRTPDKKQSARDVVNQYHAEKIAILEMLELTKQVRLMRQKERHLKKETSQIKLMGAYQYID